MASPYEELMAHVAEFKKGGYKVQKPQPEKMAEVDWQGRPVKEK